GPFGNGRSPPLVTARITGPRRVLWMRLPISPSISSASSNGERVRISVLKVIDFAPNCYAQNNEFSTVKRDVIIVHSSLCIDSYIGTGRDDDGFMAGDRATLDIR